MCTYNNWFIYLSFSLVHCWILCRWKARNKVGLDACLGCSSRSRSWQEKYVVELLNIRDVSFREFHFSIREFHFSRLVEYSKLTRHSAWTTHLMRECCNTVDVTPCSCGWAAAPGKWSDGREAVAVSNSKRACLPCTRDSWDPTDRLLSSQTHHTLWL